MKQSMLRLLCALLVLLIGAGIMAGILMAVPTEESPSAWTRVFFQTGGRQDLWLYAGDGSLLEVLKTEEDGKCATELLEEGSYYGVCREGLVQFTLTAHGIGEVRGAAEVKEGNTLSFSASGTGGELRIYGEARQEWYEYELQSQDYSCRRVLRCAVGDAIQCTLKDLPYGTYTLLENERVLCRVELTEEEPAVEVSLP